MNLDHHYAVRVEWQGNRGTGTSGYREYGREHLVIAEGKEPIDGSADRTFHGARDRWNPEEMLLAALTQCHMLSYLHVAVQHGIVVVAYEDDAIGQMHTNSDGSGRFTSATLRPTVTISSGDPDVARTIHAEARAKCFIANSVDFPIGHEPRILVI